MHIECAATEKIFRSSPKGMVGRATIVFIPKALVTNSF